MAKNTEQENISLKMEIYTKGKCLKEKCKERANIPGQIKMFMKAHLFKIK